MNEEVAVVTGGGSGIGLALGRALGRRGLRILLADLDADTVEAARVGLNEEAIDAHAEAVDIRDAAAVERLAGRAAELGRIAVVCCNAGVSTTGPNVWEAPDSTYEFAFGVNFQGLLHTLRAFVPRVIAGEAPATVVVTGSMAGLVASPSSGAYAASKAAAVAVTKALRGELAAIAPHVQVVLIAPGMVKTNLMRTSAAQQPAGATALELMETGHAALNEYGVDPELVACWALDAMNTGRFWAVPSGSDPFCQLLTAELAEVEAAIR